MTELRGDEGIVRDGARVTIRGVFDPPALKHDDLTALSVAVDFSPFQPTLYHAWRYERAPVTNVAGPVGLTVPIAAVSGLRLRVELVRPSGTEQARLFFAAGPEHGLPKLRRGTYVLAWRQAATGRLPDLTRCRWQDAGTGRGAAGRLLRRDRRRDELVEADFAHVVVAVDRVTDPVSPLV